MIRQYLILISVVAGTAFGQTGTRSDSLSVPEGAPDSAESHGWISLETEPNGCDVFLDSLFLGRSPLQRHPVTPGNHVLRLYYPSRRSWNRTMAIDTLSIDPGQHLSRVVEMGTVLTIRSDPSGADVSLRGTSLGNTPLYYSNRARLREALHFEKQGYHPLTVSPEGEADRATVFRLEPVPGQVNPLAHIRLPGETGRSRDSWITYAVSATMVTSGVLAAHWNAKGNASFERYLQSGNPSDLDATRSFDRASAISLVITEVSFAVLAYLFLVD